ncbi:MAG: ABC transporter ATP-binding protein [Acidobacteriota bacterium]
MADREPLLQLRGLTATGGSKTVLAGVDLELRRGEVLGLVGESGSGKTLTTLAILDLLPAGVERTGGSIALAGIGDPATLDRSALRRLRGRTAAMVFQDPLAALNPVLTVGTHLREVLRVRGVSRAQIRARAIELLERVALPDPADRLDAYAHQLSGGQRQRVVLALALAGEPELLIADEPTTALDVTVQAQILRLLLDLRRDLGLTILMVTHDLAVIAQTCDRVAVMDAGRVVEVAPVAELFARPRHAITRDLLAATLDLSTVLETSVEVPR